MDKTRTPIGRFRPWTVAGTPVMLLAVYMLFMAPKGITMSYLITWALVSAAGTSMVILSGAAWAANIATNYDDRSRVYGVMQGVGGIGLDADAGDAWRVCCQPPAGRTRFTSPPGRC